MPHINRVGHVVLAVRDPKTSAQFYVDNLGMELINYYSNPEFGLEMAFLSFGNNHHDIALIEPIDLFKFLFSEDAS